MTNKQEIIPIRYYGEVLRVSGNSISATLPYASLNDFCEVEISNGSYLPCQVVGFNNSEITLTALGSLKGIRPKSKVRSNLTRSMIKIPKDTNGLVLNALGQVLNHSIKNALSTVSIPYSRQAPNALTRKPNNIKLITGVKALDMFCPVAQGQRLAVIAGPGAGKSTLLSMITKFSNADKIVIGLIGERGREVNHFINKTLGEDGLAKATVVVATSDEPALNRLLAGQTATSVAEYYRDQGLNVLLIIDSLTRYARAIREIALGAGELPIRQGLPASVFSELAQLLERAGTNDKGSITAFYSLLTSNDYAPDVLTEEVTSLVDGHIILDADLAKAGIKPAINILKSLSRLEQEICSKEELNFLSDVRCKLSVIERERDLVNLGGKASSEYQEALKLEQRLFEFIKQDPSSVLSQYNLYHIIDNNQIVTK